MEPISEYEAVLIDRNQLLADFQKMRAELQAARERILYLEDGYKLASDSSDASAKWAHELQKQLQAAQLEALRFAENTGATIGDLERELQAARGNYQTLLDDAVEIRAQVAAANERIAELGKRIMDLERLRGDQNAQ